VPTRVIGFAAALSVALSVAGACAAQPAKGKAADGAMLFKQNCSACHQAAGQGVPRAFPALAGNTFVQGDPKAVAFVLLNGRGGMPNFREDLSNEQIAAVLTYVRSAWGNRAAPVAVATVVAAQRGTAGRQDAPSVLPYH